MLQPAGEWDNAPIAEAQPFLEAHPRWVLDASSLHAVKQEGDHLQEVQHNTEKNADAFVVVGRDYFENHTILAAPQGGGEEPYSLNQFAVDLGPIEKIGLLTPGDQTLDVKEADGAPTSLLAQQFELPTDVKEAVSTPGDIVSALRRARGFVDEFSFLDDAVLSLVPHYTYKALLAIKDEPTLAQQDIDALLQHALDDVGTPAGFPSGTELAMRVLTGSVPEKVWIDILREMRPDDDLFVETAYSEQKLNLELVQIAMAQPDFDPEKFLAEPNLALFGE